MKEQLFVMNTDNQTLVPVYVGGQRFGVLAVPKKMWDMTAEQQSPLLRKVDPSRVPVGIKAGDVLDTEDLIGVDDKPGITYHVIYSPSGHAVALECLDESTALRDEAFLKTDLSFDLYAWLRDNRDTMIDVNDLAGELSNLLEKPSNGKYPRGDELSYRLAKLLIRPRGDGTFEGTALSRRLLWLYYSMAAALLGDSR